MLLGTLLLALLVPAPAPVEVAVESKNARAECMKTCAGAPKDATGAVLLQCLRSCEPVDAGVR